MNTSQDHGHEHGHDHPHAAIEERDEAIEFTVLETAIRELSIAKGLFSAEDHRRFMEWYDQVGHTGGARVVARAWVDPAFKQRLLADGVAACMELGIDWLQPTGVGTPSDYTYLIVCENTPEVHNVIVCTLCSCYPRPLLGMSPAWYERSNYRRRVVRWPRQVLAEFGTIIPGDIEVRVHDFEPEDALHGAADAPGRHRGLDRRAADVDHHPRHDDRRRPPRHQLDHLVNALGDRPTGLIQPVNGKKAGDFRR